MVKRWIAKVVMVIVCSVMLSNVANAKSNFKRLSDAEIKKGAWKLDVKQFKGVVKHVKVIKYYGGDRLLLREDGSGKQNFIFLLYCVDTPEKLLEERGWKLSFDYYDKLKLQGSYVDIVIMGSYELLAETQIGLVWFNGVNLNVDLLKKGIGRYSLDIPETAIRSWYNVDELDFNYLINCFINSTDYADDNKLGVWKLYDFKRKKEIYK